MISSHAFESFKIPNLRVACCLSIGKPSLMKTFFIVCIIRGRQRGHSRVPRPSWRRSAGLIYIAVKVPRTIWGLFMMFVLTGGHSAAAHTAICPFTPSTTPSDYDILLPPQGNRRRPDGLPASHLISVCHCPIKSCECRAAALGSTP